MSEACALKSNVEWLIKHETLMIKASVAISAVILAGVLIGLWKYGVDMSAVFLGPVKGAHEPSRGMMALEGAIVAVALLFGGIFLAGVVALARKTGRTQTPSAEKAGTEETKAAE